MTLSKYNIGLDRLPTRVHEFARDWTDMALTRNLAEPIYFETPDRGLNSRIVASCTRTGQLTWELELSHALKWSDGSLITASDICSQIQRVRTAREGASLLAGLFTALRARSGSVVVASTRFPIADIRRILCNPAFGLSDPTGEKYSGNFRIETFGPSHINLGGPDDVQICIRQEIEQRTELNSEQNLVEDPLNAFDLLGPMALQPDQWPLTDITSAAHTFDMDMWYFLLAPPGFKVSDLIRIDGLIDRNEICQGAGGIVIPALSVTENWQKLSINRRLEMGLENRDKNIDLGTVAVEYSQFPCNREIANALAKDLGKVSGADWRTHCVDYGQSIYSRRRQAELNLTISPGYALFPHPVAPLLPYLFSKSVDEDARVQLLAALAAEDLGAAIRETSIAEAMLRELTTMPIVLGRIKGCYITPSPLTFLPESGWLDFHAVMHS